MNLPLADSSTAPQSKKSMARKVEVSEIQQYPGQRSIYLWSKPFNTLDNDFLLQYFQDNNIQRVLLSFSKKIDVAKRADFMTMLKASGIQIEALISTHQFIYPEKHPQLLETLAQIATYRFDGIHLDIEPHTFPDWDNNKRRYEHYYKKMLRVINNALKNSGTTLGVSIPVFYRSSFLRKIYFHSDAVYIMAYGIKDIPRMQRKLKEELAINQDKTHLALRPSDFSLRTDLEQFISLIIGEMKIEKLAIHHTRGLIALDQASQ